MPLRNLQARDALFVFIIGIALSIPSFFVPKFDDAYIHARVASNLLDYGFPYFNTNDAFKVSSSTGYTIIVAFIGRIAGLEKSILICSIISSFLASVAIFYYAHELGKNWFQRTIIPFLAVIPCLWAAYGGMETPLACIAFICAAIAHKREKESLVTISLSTACLFRFEALALFIPYAIMLTLKRRSLKWALWSFPLVIVFLLELYWFGSIFPHAAKAKAIAYNIPLTDSINSFKTFWIFGNKGIVFSTSFVAYCGFVLLLFLRDKSSQLSYFDYHVVYTIALVSAWILGGSFVFQWYFCLLSTPLFIVLLSPRSDQRIHNTLGCVVLLGLAWIGLSGIKSDAGLSSSTPYGKRAETYKVIGRELYKFCPNCSMTTSEIGALGYMFKGKLYDAFGLADPSALMFHPMQVPEERQYNWVGAIPPKYIEFRSPDFVVSMPFFTKEFRSKDLSLRYHNYDCLIGGEYFFKENFIRIHSLAVLPEDVLKNMGCHRSGYVDAVFGDES